MYWDSRPPENKHTQQTCQFSLGLDPSYSTILCPLAMNKYMIPVSIQSTQNFDFDWCYNQSQAIAAIPIDHHPSGDPLTSPRLVDSIHLQSTSQPCLTTARICNGVNSPGAQRDSMLGPFPVLTCSDTNQSLDFRIRIKSASIPVPPLIIDETLLAELR